MTLQRLIEYIEMDRGADPAYRAYDLRAHYSKRGVARALHYLGFRGAEPNMLLWQVWAELNARNVQCSELPQTLYEWFVWQRLCSREIRQWPMRPQTPRP